MGKTHDVNAYVGDDLYVVTLHDPGEEIVFVVCDGVVYLL